MTLPSAESVAARVDLECTIETPENVVLTYQLAGPSVRLSAWAVDLVARVGIMSAAQTFVFAPLRATSQGVSIAMFLVVWFLIDWFYFGISEGLFRGKTVGKHMFGLRVIHEGGYPLSIWGAILRNFVRAADSLPVLLAVPTYGVGFLTMLVSGRFRRLGDLAARTLVVEERRVTVPTEPVILEKIEPLPRNELSGYVPQGQTLALIEQFLGRRHVLTHQRGHAMALVLARALARKLDFRGDRQLVERYPMAFLARVFATFWRPAEEIELEILDTSRPAGRMSARKPAAAGAAT